MKPAAERLMLTRSDISAHRRSRLAGLFKKVLRNPKQLLTPSNWGKLLRLRQYLDANDYGRAESWIVDPQEARFRRKRFLTYDDYVEHQKSKLNVKGKGYLTEYDQRFYQALRERLDRLEPKVGFQGKVAVCLAARLGTEVRAFIDVGCFAVGVDLNPGPANKYVLSGDFHDLQFPTGTVDIIYTNSFDHVFEPERVIREIARLLKPGGLMLLEMPEARPGLDRFGTYESFYWQDVASVIELFARHGLMAQSQNPFEQPWLGNQVVFSLTR